MYRRYHYIISVIYIAVKINISWNITNNKICFRNVYVHHCLYIIKYFSNILMFVVSFLVNSIIYSIGTVHSATARDYLHLDTFVPWTEWKSRDSHYKCLDWDCKYFMQPPRGRSHKNVFLRLKPQCNRSNDRSFHAFEWNRSSKKKTM